MKKEEASGSETPQPKKRGGKVKKEEGGEDAKNGKKTKKEEEEEEIFRWWEQQDPNGDGSDKWQTLEHNGVYFPPPYESLPSHVKMKYNGMFFPLYAPLSLNLNFNTPQVNLSTFLLPPKKSLGSTQLCWNPITQRTRLSTRTSSLIS